MSQYVEKVSIIMMTYNNWRLIEDAILSVYEQSYKNIELIISDDGTLDFDLNYVNNMLNISTNKTLKSVVIVNKDNVATVKNFNSAIREAKGDLIIPLSADDIFSDSNVVSDIVHEFNIRKCKILTGLRKSINATKYTKSLPEINKRKYFIDRNTSLYRLMVDGNFISGASTYYHRSVFDFIGFFDEKYRLLEDYPFYIKALSHGVNIALFEREVIQYGLGGVSTSKVKHPALIDDTKKLVLNILQDNSLSLFDRRKVFYRIFLTTKEKLAITSLCRYPDQALTFLLSKFLSKFN